MTPPVHLAAWPPDHLVIVSAAAVLSFPFGFLGGAALGWWIERGLVGYAVHTKRRRRFDDSAR